MSDSRVKLDLNLLNSVKKAFVAMPAGADPSLGAGPVVGGGVLSQAQAAPMGGTPPMDPAAMGGMPPVDPAAMGGLPPELAALAGGGEMPGGQVSMSSAEFTDLLVTLITTLGGGKMPKPKEGNGEKVTGTIGRAPSSGGDTEAKLDQIISLLQPAAGGGMPTAGGMPPMM